MLKILRYTFLLIFITGCGYTPIYSNLNNKNINIQVENVNGNKKINKLIVQKLSKYQSENSEKVYNVKINSDYKKLILTKNAAGNATNFRLSLKVQFITKINDNMEEFKFTEKFDMKKGDTIFEEEKYENNIINDMINIIVQRFISQLIIK